MTKRQGFHQWNGFNPTMVRLLPGFGQITETPAQSFNPTMVRLLLETCEAGRRSEVATCFNPTMVRLLQCPSGRKWLRLKRFQSHNGAIAAKVCLQSRRECQMFQSHNGAIAALSLLSTPPNSLKVSIPQWCDCCYKRVETPNPPIGVSIPQWCDCC